MYIKFILRCMLSGLLSFITQAGLKASGISLDIWIKNTFNMINYNVVFWLLMFLLTCFFMFLTFIPNFFTSKKKKSKIYASSPLKIEVHEDGNAFVDESQACDYTLNEGKQHILSVQIHNNTSNKTIDSVEACINVIDSHFNELQNKAPIYLSFTCTNDGSVSFSPNQRRRVNVLSYLRNQSNDSFTIEQFNTEKKPEIFICETTPCKIEIMITGKDIHSVKQKFEIFMISKIQSDSLANRQRIFMKLV